MADKSTELCCTKDTRGQAALDRAEMEKDNIYNKDDYSAYSDTIHCPNGDTADCPNQKAVEPILGKYTE
jgi:hypothetical protein